MSRLIAAVLCTLALVATRSPAATPEPWADPALPVKDGVSLWLDASRQPAAWKHHNKPALLNGHELDVCYDASGHSSHFSQNTKTAQPRLVSSDAISVIRFDGENDHLLRSSARREIGHFTLILAAAPKSNPGGFRAFLSTTETGKNDYTTGLNADLGPFGSASFEMLNVEGRGAAGMRNLGKGSLPFRQLHLVALTGDESAIRAIVNNKPAGQRERTQPTLRADRLFLGARCYSNDAAPPFTSGFLDGDVAELLLYDRVLPAEELASLHAYLSRKHAKYADIAPTDGPADGDLLRAVENPPDVQVFVPGFTARRLPVDLTNINNLRYREDGKLLALAYDGNVYLLSDADNDGLEDKAELFWDNRGRIVSPIGMALTPPGYKHGRGLFVACKGKLSLIVDTDNDDRADKEIIVAQGWKALPHQVDALGVAVGQDGSIYFGLGCTNFTNAYLTDPNGNARYSLTDERGTILRVSPDFSKREIVCTGIRFPVGLAFNARGDLFATDQEGATWLPNGNPFDELLHIQQGRHYGFPPRHPRHLPDVIDEPSTFDYTPQHQSTCGLFFNEPVNNGPVFGPAHWRGDAIVCGESRGKLYRTRLVKTAAGYVAKNELFASLTMLTVDACISPAGDLVVATHSGAPDWGSGPKGKGRLYKLRHAAKETPQPIAAWPAGPQEVRLAFDRPLDAPLLRDITKNVSIDYGPHVAAGDRFEVIRPGYEVVQRQVMTRRKKLLVTGTSITPDRRTLVLSTARQTHAVGYAITSGPLDLAYDLTGVEVEWQGGAGTSNWTGWLPHVDLAVSRAFTTASATHDALWPLLKQPGQLKLRTTLDLHIMLRPAVQPGSKLDHQLPPEDVTITIESNLPLQLPSAKQDGPNRATLTLTPEESKPVSLELTLTTGSLDPTLTITFSTKEDPRPRVLPLRRFLLPFANPRPDAATPALAKSEMPQLKGGDWLRGRDLFFADNTGCAKCHRLAGRGSDLGPDLSNLVHRDYDSVLRDIRTPSAALNPDYIASTVRLKRNRTFHGILRSSAGEDRFIVRGDPDGEAEPFHKNQIVRVTPSDVSVMPEGLDQALSPDQLRDLMTFLLTHPLEPAPIKIPGAPAARTRAQLDAVLAAAEERERTPDDKPLRILLSAGPKDHGPGEHDYPAWQRRWSKLLSMSPNTTVSTCQGFPTRQQLDATDVVVFYSNNPGWTKEKAADLDAFLTRGGGAVYIHYAVDGHKAVPELADRIGLAWGPGARFRHGPLNLTFSTEPHPITAGFPSLSLVDESYWSLTGQPARLNLLATAPEDAKPQPLLWTREHGNGRVFVSIPGHYAWTFDDPLFRTLILRAIAWTAHRPAERLTDLAPLGARLAD